MSDESSSDRENPDFTTSKTEQAKTGKEMFEDLSRTLTDALQNGVSDAKRVIEDSLPQWKTDVTQGLYKAAYAAAYATAFGTTVASELVPEAVTKGFREGSQAGKCDADEAMRRRAEQEPDQQASDGDSSPEAAWV